MSHKVTKSRGTRQSVMEDVTKITWMHVLFQAGVPAIVIAKVANVDRNTVRRYGLGLFRPVVCEWIKVQLQDKLPEWTNDAPLDKKLRMLLSQGFLSQTVLTSIRSECLTRLENPAHSRKSGTGDASLRKSAEAIAALELPVDPAPHLLWLWDPITGLSSEASSDAQTAGVSQSLHFTSLHSH